MKPSPALSIVIPAYNEAHRLPHTLESIEHFLQGRSDGCEIIVVDDGSRDDTAAIARRLAVSGIRIRVLRNRRNRGKGASIRRGMAAARGRQILFSDADLSTPIGELRALETALAQGADIAIASRALAGSRVATRQPCYREWMGKTFNRLVQAVLLPGIHDTQCGFKLFTRAAARAVFRRLTVTRFGFDVEALYLARKLQARIVEVPVEWNNVLESKVSPLRDSLQMFFDLFRIRCRHRRFPGR